jgi:hypothetical protein
MHLHWQQQKQWREQMLLQFIQQLHNAYSNSNAPSPLPSPPASLFHTCAKSSYPHLHQQPAVSCQPLLLQLHPAAAPSLGKLEATYKIQA